MAALHAAKRGPVLLADASLLPRDKSCGGMLNEYSQDFLSRFGQIPAEAILSPRYVHFRYNDWDRGILKPTELKFLNVDRREFDRWLVSLLPDTVDVAPATSLLGFDQTAHEVRVRLRNGIDSDVYCQNLVGADGARSTVRRALGVGSVNTYVTLQDFCLLDGEIEPYFDCIYLRDVGDEFAYAYVVPKGEVAIVGSVFYPKTKRPHEKHELVLDRLRERLPLGRSTKREAWVALSVRDRADVVAGSGRVLLAGEAGGFMSPTSGEGISYALNSGAAAGQAIADGAPLNALWRYREATGEIARNVERKLKWLPFMESRAGKYLAGFVPTPVVSRVTKGL
jgi:flavin-dependent dehydrogenase